MKKLALLIGSGLLALALIGVMALLVFATDHGFRALGLIGH
jgi:hypothetical protein